MKHRNRVVVGLAMCAALGGVALADASDGPFLTIAALVNFWTNQPGTTAIHIFANGSDVYDRNGFGPAFEKEYFFCKNDGFRPQCPNDISAGSTTSKFLIDTFGANKEIILDGTLISGSGTPGHLNLKTCHGDRGVRYFVVTEADSGFSPPIFTGGNCYF